MGRVQKLVDSQSRPIILNPTAAGEPPILIGSPVKRVDNLPNGSIFFGDLNFYGLFQQQKAFVIETTTVGGDAFSKHLFNTKIVDRFDGNVLLAEAFKKGIGISGP